MPPMAVATAHAVASRFVLAVPRPGRIARRALAMTIAGVLVASTAACSGDPAPSADTRTVDVLWYGVQPDGSVLGGTLDAAVDLRRTSGGVSVDVDGIAASGAGETWTASAWTAAVMALMFYGGVPDGIELAIEVADNIDGPSAGGLMTLAALADLSGIDLVPGVSMTGTIYPNGAIGPVGGIPEKLRGAAAAGLNTVVVPASKRIAIDPRTGEEVDVAAFAAELGLEVVFVESLYEAREVLFETGSPELGAMADRDDAELRDLFAGRAEALADRLASLEVADSPEARTDDEAERWREILALEQSRFAPTDLDDDFFIEYFVAAETERSIRSWNAAVEVVETALDDPAAAIDVVNSRATATAERAAEVALEVAATEIDSIEALVALIDVTEWATDALEVASSILFRLDADTMTPEQLGVFAAELAGADHHLDHTVDDALVVALAFGTEALRDTTLDDLAVFAALLGAAVDANESLLDVKLRAEGLMLDTDEVEAVLAVSDVVDAVVDRADTDQARLVVSVADEVSRYVMTSKLLNLDRTGSSTDGLVARLNLLDPDKLAAQADLAVQTGEIAFATLAERGVDPGYLVWETEWASGIVDHDDDVVVTVDERFEALSRLWFSNINERILVALTRPE